MNFSWEIVNMETKDQTNVNGEVLQNSVVRVTWKRIGTDSEGVTHNFLGTTFFTAENVESENFIPFFNLTEQTVVTWIEEKITAREISKIDDIITNRIEKKNTIVRNPPWI